jgi:hypothetical protein
MKKKLIIGGTVLLLVVGVLNAQFTITLLCGAAIGAVVALFWDRLPEQFRSWSKFVEYMADDKDVTSDDD